MSTKERESECKNVRLPTLEVRRPGELGRRHRTLANPVVCVVLIQVLLAVPSALSRQLGDVADHDGLRVVAQVAVFPARAGVVNGLQVGHSVAV